MLYPKIENCVEKAGNKYALAILVSKRAKDLINKSPGLFADGNVKEISYALDEILTGKLVPCTHQ
jgi:DNA-directed RNA polymerase subunit omega